MNVIAVDFDETLWNNKKSKVMNVDKVNSLFENPNNFIVIYTSRSYSCFELIKKILLQNEVKFHAIVCEKIRATSYIDDRNIGGLKW